MGGWGRPGESNVTGRGRGSGQAEAGDRGGPRPARQAVKTAGRVIGAGRESCSRRAGGGIEEGSGCGARRAAGRESNRSEPGGAIGAAVSGVRGAPGEVSEVGG